MVIYIAAHGMYTKFLQQFLKNSIAICFNDKILTGEFEDYQARFQLVNISKGC